MKVLVLGDGVIGTTYAVLLTQAGHEVKHFVRPAKAGLYPRRLTVSLLDGRHRPPVRRTDTYLVNAAGREQAFDFVLISVPNADLKGAVESLREHGMARDLLLFNGIWQTREELDGIVGDCDYVLGYPIAGGRLDQDHLRSVLFDSVKLQTPRHPSDPLYTKVHAAFSSCGITVEPTERMLEWLWLHQAINAGIITAIASKISDERSLEEAISSALQDKRTMRRGIVNIRECLRVTQARGVRLRHHLRDIVPYLLPKRLSARLMSRLFRRDELSREIMLVHNNARDIVALVGAVHDTATESGVEAPGFDRDARRLLTAFDPTSARF